MRREEGDSTVVDHADQYYVLKKLTAVPRYDYSGKQSFPTGTLFTDRLSASKYIPQRIGKIGKELVGQI